MTPDLGRKAWDSGAGWISTCSEADLEHAQYHVEIDLLDANIVKL
jgi:hypothetical protein